MSEQRPMMMRPLERVAEAIGTLADKMFEGATVPKETGPMLPHAVLNELRFSVSGEIGKNSLEYLLREGWYDQCVYLWMKALDADVEAQRALLSRICGAEPRLEDVTALRDVLSDQLDSMPDTVQVQATKLAQVSRQGSYTWADKFLARAQQYATTGQKPFLVAYASLQGLRYFDRVASQVGSNVHILIPNWIADASSELCGYTVSFDSTNTSVSGPYVDFLSKDFVRPSDAVIFDETRNTGNGLRKMEAFWTQGGQYEAPVTDSIVDLSSKS